MNRLYFSADDISEAILNAGIELRPEDCMTTKFLKIADDLSNKARSRVHRELVAFADKVLQ